MHTVKSKDGTTIAYDRCGSGPALIIIGGALSVRSHPINGLLADELSPRYTVINYDRRGRGGSGDTLPYAIEREVEDIEALIDAAGGRASLYGVSSGAVLALEAASRLPNKVEKLAMYEPPLIIDDSRPPRPSDYRARLDRMIADGRRGDAVALFMTDAVGVPQEFVDQMRYPAEAPETGNDGEIIPPPWQEMEKVAHTLAYDEDVVSVALPGKPLPVERWSRATSPALVMNGAKSEPFFERTARKLAEVLPKGEYRELPDQDHAVSPQVVGPVLLEFFAQ